MAERPVLSKKEISAKIKGLVFLIADSGVSRRSIVKLLADFGVPRAQIESAESLNDALEIVTKKKPHVVFAEHDLAGKAGVDLLKAQKESLQRGDRRAFFLITNKDSNMLAASASDDEVDAVLVRPFTYQALEERLGEVVRDRIDLTPYLAKIDEGKAILEAGDPKAAIEVFREASMLDAQPEAAQYYEGAALLRSGEPLEAIRCFEWVLSVKPDHLPSMMGLFDAYLAVGDSSRAYEAGKKVAQSHSIPIKRLPDLIRLSIVNGEFDDILSFYEMFSKVEQLPSQAGLGIAAGLAVCGLYFLRSDKQDAAVAAFKKADILSKSAPQILKRIISALITAGLQSEANGFLARASEEVLNSRDVRFAEINYWDTRSDPARVVQIGTKAISEGLHDERVFEQVIRASLAMNRSGRTIEELVQQGSRLYPEKAEAFAQLLQKAR